MRAIIHKAIKAALLISFFVPLFHSSSYGHAFPDHSEPRVGSSITVAPPLVRIWFTASLEPAFSTISVQDASGKKVDKGDGRVAPGDATLLETGLTVLTPGTYKVIWNVAARDGHRTMGDFTFTVK